MLLSVLSLILNANFAKDKIFLPIYRQTDFFLIVVFFLDF